MENTNLQRVLKTLSKTEWRSLGDFIASPYFNKNPKFIKFHNLLTPFYGDFDITNQEKEKIFRLVTKAAKYNDPSYRNLCSDFLELVQGFLTFEYMVKGNTNKQQYLIRAFLDRQMNELAERTLNKTKTEIATGDFGELEKLHANIWMNDAAILLSILNNRNRMNASNEEMKNDETYIIATEWVLAKIFNAFLNYMKACKSTGSTIDKKRIHIFLDLYDAIKPFSNIVTEIYYLQVKMIMDHDDEMYFAAKKLYSKNKNAIHKKNHENILIGLLDHANDKLHLDERWRTELFELSEIKLQDKLWKENKGLSYATLFNAFMNALQMNKISYAEKLIKQNIQHLHPSVSSSIEYLCKAWLYFYNNEIERAHEQLTKVETENILIKYELRTLQCLIYFENKDWEVLASYLESFRHFILYNKSNVDERVTTLFSDFCKYLSSLMKSVPFKSKNSKTKLRNQITEAGPIYLKSWFLEHLAE